MNHDKIDQLMVASGVRFVWLHDVDYENFSPYEFTRLIVQECLLCCERVISDPVQPDLDKFEQGGIHCMEEIKHIFGVE